MKYLPFILTGVVSIVVSLAGDWAIRVYLLKETINHPHPVIAATPHPAQPPLNAQQSRINDWQEFHKAREQTLRDNPDLASEYQQLRAEMQEQETVLNSAMVKADPRVAPIIAKLELLRHPPSSPGDTPNQPNPGAVNR